MHGSLYGEQNRFVCGSGTDTLEANDFDEVAPECEKVYRRQTERDCR